MYPDAICNNLCKMIVVGYLDIHELRHEVAYFGEVDIKGYENGTGLLMNPLISYCFWKGAMLRCRKFFMGTICLSIFASTTSSYAEEG
jgi:hypothetical protein